MNNFQIFLLNFDICFIEITVTLITIVDFHYSKPLKYLLAIEFTLWSMYIR
jgi:hypothetical protein